MLFNHYFFIETPNELSKSQEKLNEIVYSTFFAVSCDEIEQINKK